MSSPTSKYSKSKKIENLNLQQKKYILENKKLLQVVFMLKNEIYYSLSKYEIQAIEQQIKSNSSSTYLDIVVSFKRHEIDKMYHLLSNLYLYENKEHIQNQIWETFLCNKILNEIEKQELIYFSHDLNEEMKVLTSASVLRCSRAISLAQAEYLSHIRPASRISGESGLCFFFGL